MALIEQEIGRNYAIYNGDSMEVLKELPSQSIHLSLYSPPFATSTGALYTYSSDDRDLSNSRDYEQFFEHYAFFVAEIARATLPGRMSAVHCIDIPSGNSGCDYLVDFPGDIIRLYNRHGFRYTGRYHIWKEPLGVRNRTMAKNLAHATIVEDSSRCSVASADYLLMFRRNGKNPIPIAHPVGLLEYAGSKPIPPELIQYRGWKGNQIQNRYSQWIWRQYASAFWDDVRIGRVLPFREAREEEDEKHVHPLQLDVIERCLTLWSNPGETLLTPFMGVGSEVAGALVNGRRAIGAELKTSYYRQAQRNIKSVLASGWSDDTGQGSILEELDPDAMEDPAIPLQSAV